MTRAFKRVFQRENAMTLVLIAACIMTATGVAKKIGLNDSEAVAALVGILAIDILIEKLGYLSRIEHSINDGLGPRLSALEQQRREQYEEAMPLGTFILSRQSAKPFDFELPGTSEVWIAGKGLNGFLTANLDSIASAARTGTSFRFIVQDPTSPEQLYAIARNSRTNPDAKAVRQLIETSLQQLARLAEECPADTIFVRLAYAPLYNGYTIYNPNGPKGVCHTETYGFRISGADRRTLVVRSERDPDLFKYHIARFEESWRFAREHEVAAWLQDDLE
jgi:hypothetical protein